MATTWFDSLHVGKKRSKATVISDIIDYAKNPHKTDDGKLISSYACDSRIADAEFLLSKREYEYITGRNQGSHDVIAYHIRQSFKPGEIDAETANRMGYELAMSFTKGYHAFIVATHIDRKHIHNHIIFNSTAISCDRKFQDFKRSGKAVRRISDLLCLQNGLSVIENPGPSKGNNYAEWLGNKEPSWQEKLRRKIDEVLPACSTFEDFLSAMKTAGYKVNDKRKHITFLAPGQKQPSRLNTLGGNHTEEAIRERIAGTRIVGTSGDGRSPYVSSVPQNGIKGGADNDMQIARPKATGGTSGGTQIFQPNATGNAQPRVSLLIDIQAKIQAGKGEGYERWARIFNLKEAAKTLLFLQENGIDSYEDLVKKASSASGDFAALSKKIKDADKRLAEITELQKYIGNYGKTRDTFAKYKASGWDRDFYESQRADITLHRAAKKYFDSLGLKKLPKISELKQEYAALLAEKKKLYAGYHAAKNSMRELVVAKDNAEKILGITPEQSNAQSHETQRPQQRNTSHDR